MTLAQLQTYVVGVLQGYFPNKAVLDKLSESEDGTLLFNGMQISGEALVTDAELQQAIEDTLAELGVTGAKIGDQSYATLEEAVAAATEGQTITLLNDAVLETAIKITKDLTINLNGMDITMPEDPNGDGAFWVTAGTLTINGTDESVINSVGKNGWNIGLFVNGGNAIINGGHFTNVGANTGTDEGNDQFDLIYVKGGSVTINGGIFSAQTPRWTLNVNNTAGGTITAKGGTFYQFDPSGAMTDDSGGGTSVNYVAEGYIVQNTGDTYSVVKNV